MKRLLMVVEKLTAPEKTETKEQTVPKPAPETAAPKPARPSAPQEKELDDLPMDAFDDALDDAWKRFYVDKEKLSDFSSAPQEEPEEIEQIPTPAPANVEPVVFDDPDADSDYLDPEEDHD